MSGCAACSCGTKRMQSLSRAAEVSPTDKATDNTTATVMTMKANDVLRRCRTTTLSQSVAAHGSRLEHLVMPMPACDHMPALRTWLSRALPEHWIPKPVGASCALQKTKLNH